MKRFDVYIAQLDPARGSEMAKTRPCVIVSPDSMNGPLRTVVAAPLTSTRKRWPSRVDCKFAGQHGQVALDQIRAIDKSRLIRRLGSLHKPTTTEVCERLVEMFGEAGG